MYSFEVTFVDLYDRHELLIQKFFSRTLEQANAERSFFISLSEQLNYSDFDYVGECILVSDVYFMR